MKQKFIADDLLIYVDITEQCSRSTLKSNEIALFPIFQEMKMAEAMLEDGWCGDMLNDCVCVNTCVWFCKLKSVHDLCAIN